MVNCKRKLYLIVGTPGAGKSTYLKEKNYVTESHITISRDAIRFSIVKEDEEYFSHEKEVYNEFIKQIKNALKFYKEIYVDATHLNERSRARILRSLGTSIENIEINAIAVRTSLNRCIEQNEQRKGTRAYVPPKVIETMYSQLTLPSKEEGFEHIYIIENN